MNAIKRLLQVKNTILVAVLVLVMAMLAVVIHRRVTFPAEECVQLIMDVMSKGTGSYEKKLEAVTGEKSTKVQEIYEEAVSLRKERLKQYFGITALTGQGEEMLEEFVEDLYCDYIDYDVKGAKKKNKNYTVTVEVSSMDFSSLADEKELQDSFREKTENGEYLLLNEAEYQTEFLKYLLEHYTQALLKEPGYNKKKEYTLTLKKSGNTYLPLQEDYEKIEAAFILFPEK